MNKHIASWILLANTLLFTLFLSGCSNNPYLTIDNSYNIKTTTVTGETQTVPIMLPWNFNFDVMQNLLLECSFVLSDLKTPDPNEPVLSSEDTIMLESIFPTSQQITFTIDKQQKTMNITSIQIEVSDPHIGRVILNKTTVLQGINDPNLQPAYQNFINLLDTKN